MTAGVVEWVAPAVLESYMRRFLIGPIIASCIAWGAIPLPTNGQTNDVLPPVRIVPAGEPVFEIIDRAHGLQGTTVLTVASDPHGFIWVGSDAGIQRFDGRSFFNLDRDPNLPGTLESRFIYTLAPSSNSLWIVAPNGLIQRLDESTGRLVPVPLTSLGGDPERFSWIGADAQGRLWRSSDEGLIRLDRNGQVTWVMPKGLDMAFSPDRTELFVVTADRRVVVIDTSEPRRVATAFNLPAQFRDTDSSMTADVGGIWFLADSKLWRLDWEPRSLRQIEMPPAFPQAILSMARADDGTLWFGTQDDGLWRYDPGQGALSVFRHNPDDPHSLRPGPVLSLAIDRSNNLWMNLGSWGLGRLRLSQTRQSHFRVKGGNRVCALSEADRRLVVGLCPGGVMELERSTGQLRPLPTSLALPERTRAIIGDGKQGLWITSVHEGLLHWQPGGSTRRFIPGDPIDPVLTGAYLDGRKRLWISHLRGLAVLEPGEQEPRAILGHEGTRPHIIGIANDVSPAPNGALWIGTSRGLVSFQPETSQVRRYPHDRDDSTSLSDNDVLQVYTDKGGRLWVGTRAGLNRLTTGGNDPPTFKRYGRSDGLPDITVTAIINDAQGALWVGTNRGVARWNPEEDRFQSYLPADGIPDAGIYPKAALLGSDGSLYFGTSTGLWRFDPQAIRIADPVPIVLSSYEVGDRTIVNLQGKRLPNVKADYGDSRVAFRIAVLGDARRLSYRLQGLEDQWREMPGDLNIAYQHLPPGAYRLQVRQLQRDGKWGAPDLSLPIEIAPPFWRTGWAYLIYALAGIALLAASARAFTAWRHRALREQLKESHARLSVALHAARFGMWAWDVNTDEAELDPYARELLGVPDGVQPLPDIFNRMHPEDRPRIRGEVDRALRDDVAVDFEFRLSTEGRDTAWTWVEGHAVPYRRPGKTAFVIGVNRDATQRKREQHELEESKQAAERALEELTRSRLDLAMALESGDLGVWRWAAIEARIGAWMRDKPLDCDTNVRRIFGWPEDADVDGRRYLLAIHPDNRREVLARLLPVFKDGGSYTDQFRILRPDGETRCIAVRAMCLQTAEGISLTGIVHDVTVEEALKASLQRAAEEAQLATEAKGRFLATMSHEIRTPINGVIGMVELLFETPVSEEQQQMLGICRDSAYMLLAIINDILDFSKIEAGKLNLEHVPLSPRRLVESVTESLRAQAARKGIDLDVFVSPDVPRRLMGDRVRLRQVLTNLIGNAVKFTEQGGVRVYASTMHDGRRPMLRFDVVDTGIGMDRRTLDSLFEPFQQADAATTRRFGGTGLGLTIVKHLVSLMDGTIECDSTIASGSRFSVALPMEPVAVDEPPKEPTLPATRVLALCDAGERATLLQELGRAIGVEVVPIHSAEALLEQLAQARNLSGKVVVLLDKTRRKQHEALCRYVRGEESGADAPILAVRPDSQREMCDMPGVSIVAGSPFTAAALERGLQSALGLASPMVPAIAIEPTADRGIPDTDAATARILLAEDNATNREVISRQLRQLGYACDLAEDGQQAWQMLQAGRDRYQLLLTDCHMPQLDGYGLTKRIRQDERATGGPHLAIVAITANALLGEGERCLAMGMDAFLAKPVRIPDLADIVNRMLPNREITETVSAPRFGSLSVLARDEDALHRLLDTFVGSVRADLNLWAEARASGDRDALEALAHKLKSGCRQLGEESAASALEAVERHRGTNLELETLAALAQIELERSVERAKAFQQQRSATRIDQA